MFIHSILHVFTNTLAYVINHYQCHDYYNFSIHVSLHSPTFDFHELQAGPVTWNEFVF